MRTRKWYEISIFTVACILVNYIGRYISQGLDFPLWLDSIGTTFTAYLSGPVCGAIVGAVSSLIIGMSLSDSYIYAAANVLVGITVGMCARRKWYETMYGTLSASFIVTMIMVAVCVPMNMAVTGGYTENIWGDAVIGMLRERGFHNIICYTVGQFYIDFPDKVLSGMLLYFGIRVYRKKIKIAKFLPILLIAVSTAILPTQAKAETEDYNAYIQKLYNGENGLLGGAANDMAHTEDGVLWVGTYNGLYRYSGSEFQLMDEFKTVQSVNCLDVDEEGRLWVGTNDGGISVCINEKVVSILDKEMGLPSDSVRCIEQGADDNYYVGTSGSLAIVTIGSGIKVKATIPEIKFSSSISADDYGNAAAVSNKGVIYLLKGSEILDRVGTGRGEYTCVSFGEEGVLYAGTSAQKIVKFKSEGGRLIEIGEISCAGSSNIKEINFMPNGDCFVCADNGIGVIGADGVYKRINTGRFSNSVDHMITDYQGNLWFTSSRLGVMKLCKSVMTDVYAKLGMTAKVVNATIKWNGSMYFATDEGIDVTDEAMTCRTENELSRKLNGIRVRCLMADSQNRLWIITSGAGVWSVTPEGEITVYNLQNGMPSNKFRMAMECENGVIAVAGDTCIAFITNGAVTGIIGAEQGLKNPKVLCLTQLDDGRILAGTDGDGIAVIKDGEIERMIRKEDGLYSDIILRLVKDESGIFVVTGSGICFLDKEFKLRRLDSIPYRNNFDIVRYEDKLFILGSAGVYVIDREAVLKDEIEDYTCIDARKGLKQVITPNSWNYKNDDNVLFLSTDSGVIKLSMDNYDTSPRSYRMRLKTVMVDDEPYNVERGETLEIPRGAKRVELLPEIINYSANDPYIQIYMEGFDSEPKLVRQSKLNPMVYTNLHRGDYCFHVGVLDNGGKVIEEIVYNISKEKELYDNGWFLAYFILVFTMAIVYITWMLFRTQIKRVLALQKRELEIAKKQVEMGNEAIITIARTVDAKDKNTSEHSTRVSEYSVMIAKELGFSEKQCEEIKRTALLHDIGKIAIPDSILNKPGKLSDEEYAIMKSHVVEGAQILEKFTAVGHIVEGALYHHERYDGRGYVNGLSGEDIPINARIIGLADAFDAMTANRVYRKKLDFDYVLEEVKRCSGTQFDPKMVEVLLKLIDRGDINIDEIYGTGEGEE